MNNKIYSNLKNTLLPKDGFQHILMLNNSILLADSNNKYCLPMYTQSVNEVLLEMQKNGYEIIDIKTTTLPLAQYVNAIIQTMIIYK